MKSTKTSKKVYSAREAMQFLPQVASEPTLRKFIEEDLQNGNSLKAIVQRIGKQKRYFIPADSLDRLVATY